MFGDRTPRHFLGYSVSDQRTVRELVGRYDGILVPGTIAAFQREGTAGFVLTLSATDTAVPYVIDPRFPLFQQALPSERISHEMLAGVLGDPELRSLMEPSYGDFTQDRIDQIASAWTEFNLGYRTEESAKFQKYAERLGEQLSEANANAPQRIIAPYFCVNGPDDPWWERSVALYEATVRAAAGRIEVTQVLATSVAEEMEALVEQSGSGDVCIWVSGLSEIEASPSDLAAYGSAIRALSVAGRRSFALYGGFFAVALSAVGLGGCSHGIGYGEHREWLELPRSGPAPARYYLPTVHRYTQQDVAFQLWRHDPGLVSPYAVRSPITLEYHDLKLHSVMARAQEIDDYRDLDLATTIERIEEDRREFDYRLYRGSPNRLVQRAGRRLTEHIPRWLHALRRL